MIVATTTIEHDPARTRGPSQPDEREDAESVERVLDVGPVVPGGTAKAAGRELKLVGHEAADDLGTDESVLSEIGEKNGVTVSDEELQRAVIDQVRQYPGQEQQVYDYFRKTPEAIQSLRAPIYEEKVVDHLLATVNVTDKTVTKDELMKDDEEELSSAA